ncbi:MAG: methyltransferase domain-containing protein [Candidatus Solibacter sp.]
MAFGSWRRRLRPRPLIQQLEIRDVVARALEFQARLAEARLEADAPEPGWYPWDSFGTLTRLNELLTGRHRFLDPMIGDDPVLDLGCGDGDLAFLFEDLGYRVCAVDHAATNYNRMRGVEALKIALDSSVRIEELDLDAEMALPVGRCGLALCLGILYHLKNPYGVLEGLSRRARYCLLSTAVTRFAPNAQADVNSMAAAFLAGRDGLRGDETNYWIFTETGLRTLADRCGWDVCDWMMVGAEDSILWNRQQDERVFCLLRSRVFETEAASQLVAGWHGLENGAWRWTAGKFSLEAPGGQRVCVKGTAPENLAFPVTLTAHVGETEIGHHILAHAGAYECAQMTPQGGPVRIDFAVDRVLPPDAEDGRERGLVVLGVEIG